MTSIWCILLLIIYQSLVISNDKVPNSLTRTFKIGTLHFNTENYDIAQLTSLMTDILHQCYESDIFDTVANSWNVGQSYSLIDLASRHAGHSHMFELSHRANWCSGMLTNDQLAREMLYHVGLVLWPWNNLISKNYGYILDWHSHSDISRSLLQQCYDITNDTGCLLHTVFTSKSPLYLDLNVNNSNINEFQIILSSGYEALFRDFIDISYQDANNLFRELPLNHQYLGYSPGLLSRLFHDIVVRAIPSYQTLSIPKNSISLSRYTPSQRIRFGIISEHEGNSSPALCFLNVLKFIKLNAVGTIELILFKRNLDNLRTAILDYAERENIPIIDLDHSNIVKSSQEIIHQKIDVLLYLALPTEKFTVLLSYLRLAPIQIQYGIGHPISSGSEEIDYSVIGGGMMYPSYDSAMTKSSSLYDKAIYDNCLSIAYNNSLNDMKYEYPEFCLYPCNVSVDHWCSSRPHYTEQIVAFDSMGYHMNDSMVYLDEARQFNPLEMRYNLTCDELMEILSACEISHEYFTVDHLGCITNSNQISRKVHLYFNIQDQKKSHPKFDKIIAEIITRDPLARIMLSVKSKLRVSMRIQSYIDEQRCGRVVDIRQHLVFVKRVSHAYFLRLLAISDVFLVPNPFGAGITSSDALSMCVPIIVLPSELSVIQLSFNQIIEIDNGTNILSKQMIADNSTDYVNKALSLAVNSQNDHGIRETICNSKVNLFGQQNADRVGQEWIDFIHKIVKYNI